ncbi:hypothetical protein PISMIDRAFT_681333 [Pisolithus microcarpus 441]|uniref:Uncharacterized protein n=1 Tax=Pisolithus microcarpus 441 TaxID=765257 RepID=A0A0C9YX91_9AGAM|nr:hypothetical protein BKA83DRAFT_681333 [Pisolithus microcarpus]KIK21401.1 hypothetical protein PISMIDRAFT_681333 [Pisolithus microcarpus 441]
MTPGKQPTYRTSYLLRFHPYERVKPSSRERVMANLYASEEDGLFLGEEPFTSPLQSSVPDFRCHSELEQPDRPPALLLHTSGGCAYPL